MDKLNDNNSGAVTYGSATHNVDDLQPSHDIEIHQETVFHDGGVIGEIPGAAHPPYRSGAMRNDIREYFSRPMAVKNGTIANAAYGNLYTKVLATNDTNYFSNSGFIGNMAGVIGFRATFCFKLEISATPQAAGIFKLGVAPMDYTGLAFNPINYPTAYCTLPSAEINLADTSSCTLKYPFTWDTDYLLVNNSRTYCQLGLVSYTPFQADITAGLSTTYQIHFWLEDVELIGPGTSFTSVVVPQMAGQGEFKAAGPVSKMMSLANLITNKVGTYVPSLLSYTRPLSWVFSGVGTIASQFGWSRPNDGGMAIMSASVGRGINNVTGMEHAQEFGMYQNNEVGVVSHFAAKDYDEMSICGLTCIPCAIAQVQLNGATDVSGQYKWICNVDPTAFTFQKGTGFIQSLSYTAAGPAFLPSTIFGVSQFFNAWRGDLVFRFKIARSKFMGGRLLVGFNPTPDDSTSAVPQGRRYDYISEIVDIRSTSTFDFEVPFQYYQDFCGLNHDRSVGYRSTGSVFLQVIEPLVSSGQTATTCYIEVEVFSKCGLVFANANGTLYAPAPETAPLVAQMGMEEDLDVLKDVSGEAILSIKQIASRPDWRGVTFATNAIYNDDIWATTVFPTVTAGIWSGPNNAFNQFTQWYKFWRGSVIWKYLPQGVSATTNISWNTYTGHTSGQPISQENRICNIIRRPFYAQHNRNAFPLGGGVGNFDTRKMLFNNGGLDGASYVSIVPGDDFQFGGFVWVPPLIVTQANVNFTPKLYF